MNLTASGSDQSWFVIAATRILLDILEGRSTSRARNAARRAHEFFETSLKANPSKHKIDCAQGCNFCCHVSVVATAPEIFLVANAIREQHKDDYEAVLQRVKEADEKTRGISSMQRAQRRIPCALLGSDGLCTVYTSRPGACRGFTSTSKLACQRGFNGEDVAVSTPQVWTSLRSAHKQALWAALAAAKLPVENYEYHHALRVALDDGKGVLPRHRQDAGRDTAVAARIFLAVISPFVLNGNDCG
jgi:Fe-S-cluster containining protein